MKFGTAYGARAKRDNAPTGDKLQPKYEMEISERGHKTLKLSNIKENVYDRIQESLEETKIENILRRAVAGDETALAVTSGQYMDITNAPKSLAEAQQLIIKATDQWEKLPVEIRREFDHSIEKYINEAGTEKWLKVFKSYEEQKNGKKEWVEPTEKKASKDNEP